MVRVSLPVSRSFYEAVTVTPLADMSGVFLQPYLVAHNLIRCVMAQAAGQQDVTLERMSFKGTVDALRQYSNATVLWKSPTAVATGKADLVIIVALTKGHS